MSNSQISVTLANKWKKAWKEKASQASSTIELKNAFAFPVEEMKKLLEVPGATYIRFYQGIDENVDKADQNKAFVVAAKENPDTGTIDDIVNENGGAVILDFAKPCPPYCGGGGG